MDQHVTNSSARLHRCSGAALRTDRRRTRRTTCATSPNATSSAAPRVEPSWTMPRRRTRRWSRSSPPQQDDTALSVDFVGGVLSRTVYADAGASRGQLRSWTGWLVAAAALAFAATVWLIEGQGIGTAPASSGSNGTQAQWRVHAVDHGARRGRSDDAFEHLRPAAVRWISRPTNPMTHRRISFRARAPVKVERPDRSSSGNESTSR